MSRRGYITANRIAELSAERPEARGELLLLVGGLGGQLVPTLVHELPRVVE